jgi:hypothetical protein|tara:strand:- start:103 stop:321 length:219 start_codon:yes stop_codon:yes gene_type:complete
MGKTIKTWLTLNEGILVLKKNKIKTNRVTFLSWVKEYDLGHKVGGRWVIFPERIKKFMKDNFHIGKIYAKKK